MANGVFNNPLKVEELTPVLTKTSGTSVFVEASGLRVGRIVFLSALFRNSGGSTATGGNSFVGTISGIPAPIGNAVGSSYSGSTAIMSAISPELGITVRVLAAQLSQQTSGGYIISWLYLTDN